MNIPSAQGWFQNVTLSDSELMITKSDIYLQETTKTLKLVEEVNNPGGV